MNVRSSIIGKSGGAQEAQQDFLKLFESVVIEEDISKSVQRYQLAVQEAKLRLDFVIAPGNWLMPSHLIINTESVVGYNNELKKASNTMRFGMNDSVNRKSRSVGIHHNLGSSKVKLPHAESRAKQSEPQVSIDKQTEIKPKISANASETKETPHETNIAILTLEAVGIGWYLFR